MKRWRIAIVLAIAACASKKEERAAPPAPDPALVPRPVPVEPVPQPVPVDAAQGTLPLECQRYRTMVVGLGSCPALASHVRDAAMRDFFALENTWSTASPAELAALAGRCSQSADALRMTAGSCAAVTEVPPVVAAGSSRTGPIERGVPLDQTALGPLAHPFGALEFLRAGMTRDEILAALPNARRDGEEIVVPLGVEELMADIDLDYTGRLDVVKITLPETAREVLVKAWGPPTPTDAWFNRTRRWRADFEGGVLMIGPYVPLAELLGRGPDGLAETKALIGATPAELTQRFGDRIAERDLTDDDGDETGVKGYRLLLPATDVCKYYTILQLEMINGRVGRALLRQCFDGDADRRAALAALESKWGRATPSRGADDRPLFTFNVPRRRVEARLDEATKGFAAWRLVITAR